VGLSLFTTGLNRLNREDKDAVTDVLPALVRPGAEVRGQPIRSMAATAACRARSHQLSGRLLAATDVLMTGGQAIQNNCAGCHTDARSGAARFFRASPEGVC
jgi:hypothetical protein